MDNKDNNKSKQIKIEIDDSFLAFIGSNAAFDPSNSVIPLFV